MSVQLTIAGEIAVVGQTCVCLWI